MTKNSKTGPVDRFLSEYKAGHLDRRAFIQSAMSVGLTAAVAQSLSLAASGRAFAKTTREVEPVSEAYDYIVVGAGSSGGTFAGTLAMQSDARILVLEAGGVDSAPEIHNPRDWALTLDKRYVRHFKTVPQKNVGGRVIDWPRAEVLGGCSSINAMIYCRGNKADYDSWAAAGNKDWDYTSVLKDYKALEDWQGGADAYRGTGGPLHVTQPAPGRRSAGGAMFIEGAESLGYKETPDFNGAQFEGPAWVNFTIYDGKRQSTAVAFLKPAMETRKNLSVLTEAPVTRLIVEGGRCTGVEYLHAGKPVKVKANSEVIVTAGAVATPWLMMLSGLGPAADLRKLGIPVVADLPGVGQNLQDHVLGAGVNYEAKAPLAPSFYNASEVYMWSKSDSSLKHPDIATLYLDIPFATPDLPFTVKNGYSILCGVMQPQSRGSIRLASADPRVDPLIDPNYLGTDQDFKALKAGMDLAREIGASAAFSSLRSKEILPGPAADKAAYQDFLRRSVWTYFHPTSTCRMGTDDMAVVDETLRVKGVKGLRIADVSVLPHITTGNTNAPAILVGWRAAKLLRQQG
ncbi:GMC family oxidoreductase [Methylorubrum thiocyanatum]|uniref:GMC family oxidoreductase n=1 Tax=Methylorubrum thiocyanatum TaxID=47958 RepID=UPI00398C24B2